MQHILQHLFQADNLGDVPRERLEALVEEYPSFGIAHYLLSSKLRAEQAGHFEEETRKTNLYFSNPFWLQWMLQQEPVNGVEKGEPAGIPAHVAPAVEEPVEHPETEHWVGAPRPEYTATSHWQEEEHQPEPVAAELPVVTEELVVTEEPVVPEEFVVTEVPIVPEVPVAPEVPVVPEVPGAPAVEELILEEPAPRDQAAAEPVIAEQPLSGPVIVEQALSGPVIAEQAAAKPDDRIIEPPLVFESYHMIDYFASQGIKLAPDENPADRLGKQLKSFTEWLKVMKRLPQKEGAIASDIIAENKIQAIAAHSIEGKEVVTETMAEVLAMQGMREKASEVYHKLSLLNPGKSGYFAEKIEQLKTN